MKIKFLLLILSLSLKSIAAPTELSNPELFLGLVQKSLTTYLSKRMSQNENSFEVSLSNWKLSQPQLLQDKNLKLPNFLMST
jgi:hypothetical protein